MSDWRHRAACQDVDPELFFPVSTGGRGPEPSAWDRVQAEPAVAVCRSCPVVDECRRWAVDNRITDGVFGAMLPYDRAVWADQRGARPAPPEPEPETPRTGRPSQETRTIRALLDGGVAQELVAAAAGVTVKTLRRKVRGAS